MGNCCDTSAIAVLKSCLRRYYIKEIKAKLDKNKFYSAKKDAFASRINKENNVSVDVAKMD